MKQFHIFFKRYWPYLAYFLISVIFLSPILFHKGLPFSQDWSWPLFNPGKRFWLQFPDFSSGYIGMFGKYILLTLSGLGFVVASSSLLFKLVIFIVHFSAAVFFFFLAKKFTKSTFVAFVAGLAYAFSPYIFIRTVVGFLFSMIAYAFLPLFFSIFLESKKSIWQFVALGFIFSAIFSQTQAGLLLSLILIVFSVVCLFYRRFSIVKDTILTFLALIMVNLPWIVYVAVQPKVSLASGNAVTTLGRIASLPHSYRLMLMSADFEFTNNFFMILSHVKLYFFGWLFVWLVCFFAIFNKKYRPLVLSLIISAVAIIPFFKGPAGHFGSFYLFVYNHFPQIMVFRDTDHFEFLIAFVLVVLFTFGLDWLWQKIDISKLRLGIKFGFKALFAASAIVIIYPYMTFNYAGYTPMRQIPPSYNQLYNYFQDNTDICHKIYYPPGLDFVYFKGDKNPGASNGDSVAGSLGIPYLNGGTSILNTPSAEMFYQNQLVSQFYEKNDNGGFVSLMNQDNIDCVVVRQDIDTKYAEAMNLKHETDPIILNTWEQNNWLAMTRSKKGLQEIKSFSDNIFIFKIDPAYHLKAVDNSSAVDKSASQQFNPSTSLRAGNIAIQQLPLTDWADVNSYYKDGWSRGRYDFWRKYLFTQLRQDFIYTDKTDTNFPQGQQKLDNSKFLISKNIGEEKFVWKKVGSVELNGETNIEIKNISGENAVADIVLVKE
ncbi:MAG: hypothetical protein NTY30_04645 [Candidatus Berkelbacteria bacterium]|nr:hypothetical protein [Candidatus Berkelbacteria bacterium]